MSLLIMACHDTEENGRSEYTERTLKSLSRTVNWDRHRLVVVDNGSCQRTKLHLQYIKNMPDTGNFGDKIPGILIITNEENLGTAKAINQGLKLRQPGEFTVKVDNDIEFHSYGWVYEMEACFERDPNIGIVGLKRKDIDFDGQYVSLSHVVGQRWVTVERGGNIMGTCTMFNHTLVDKIGAMVQPGLYGFDDCLYCLRSELAGFWNCYLPHIDIDHIDTGANPQTQVKWGLAGAVWDEYHKWHQEYIDGIRPLWEGFE